MVVQHVHRVALDTARVAMICKLRVLGLDGVVELRVAAIVAAGTVEEVLVADLDIGQRERRGWPSLMRRAPQVVLASPVTYSISSSASCTIRRQGRAGGDMLVVQRVAGEDGQDRLHLQVFAPFQHLQQAHAVGRAIAPRALMAGPLVNRADRLFPVEPLGDRVAFQVVAAGHPQEGGLHVAHLLHQIDAVAVRAVVEGRRHQRDLGQPDRARLLAEMTKRFAVEGVTFPVVSVTVYCFQSARERGHLGRGAGRSRRRCFRCPRSAAR